MEILDEKLDFWVRKNSLSLNRSYKDEEVRSINIVSNSGNKYQIWIELNKKEIIINVWNYKNLKTEYKTILDLFTDTLDRAKDITNLWENYGNREV